MFHKCSYDTLAIANVRSALADVETNAGVIHLGCLRAGQSLGESVCVQVEVWPTEYHVRIRPVRHVVAEWRDSLGDVPQIGVVETKAAALDARQYIMAVLVDGETGYTEIGQVKGFPIHQN